MRCLVPAAIAISSFLFSLHAGDVANTLREIAKRPLYVQPIATTLATMTSSGWYQSASVDQSLGFAVSLPITLVYLNNGDRQYSDSYDNTGCIECRQQQATNPAITCRDCEECPDYTAPTIFGTIKTPVLHFSQTDTRGNVIDNTSIIDEQLSSGIPALAELSLLPFATLQASLFWHHTALTLRYFGLPTISGFNLQLPGVGIQHEINHLLPSLPVKLSVAAHATILNIAWTPDEKDVSGILKMNGISSFMGVLAGFNPGFIEFFMEAGWEHGHLTPSGNLLVEGDLLVPDKNINGRNAFRAALNIALPIKYHPVIGGVGGAQFGNVINLISYRSKEK